MSSVVDFSIIVPLYEFASPIEAHFLAFKEKVRALDVGTFEILVVPNGKADARLFAVIDTLRKLEYMTHGAIRVCYEPNLRGKGAAVRCGVRHALGKWVAYTDADIPYDLTFLKDARPLLEAGVVLINANRRSEASRFDVPVHCMHLVYRRHVLSLILNRFLRWGLPVKTRDTQAGMKVMETQFAKNAFEKIQCEGFLFDIELFIVQAEKGARQADLPVHFFLSDEKSSVKLIKEFFISVYWLVKIKLAQRRGHYSS